MGPDKNQGGDMELMEYGMRALRQMNIGFFQGQGIGSLMTMLSVLFSRSKLDSENKSYLVPERIFALSKESYDRSQKIIESFSKLQTIFEEIKIYETTLPMNRANEIIGDFIGRALQIGEIKKQKIEFISNIKGSDNRQIVFNEEKINILLNELIINSCKYSKSESLITADISSDGQFFIIKIINPAQKNEDGSMGVEGRKEELIFSPFYRINSVMDDKFIEFEEFSFGLGLAVVKKIVDLHRGTVSLSTEKNQNKENDLVVVMTVYLPIK